VYSFDVLGYKS